MFFDWDWSTITPAGMQVVARAADQYKAGGPVRLEVSGYTDLSGSAGYNQRLSERRANAVAEALARLGVPRGDMAVNGRGIDNPRIPTSLGCANRKTGASRSCSRNHPVAGFSGTP